MLLGDLVIFQHFTCHFKLLYDIADFVVVKMFSDFGKMFLIILGSIVLGALIWFLLRSDPEPLLGIYAQPGVLQSSVQFSL